MSFDQLIWKERMMLEVLMTRFPGRYAAFGNLVAPQGFRWAFSLFKPLRSSQKISGFPVITRICVSLRESTRVYANLREFT